MLMDLIGKYVSCLFWCCQTVHVVHCDCTVLLSTCRYLLRPVHCAVFRSVNILIVLTCNIFVFYILSQFVHSSLFSCGCVLCCVIKTQCHVIVLVRRCVLCCLYIAYYCEICCIMPKTICVRKWNTVVNIITVWLLRHFI